MQSNLGANAIVEAINGNIKDYKTYLLLKNSMINCEFNLRNEKNQ